MSDLSDALAVFLGISIAAFALAILAMTVIWVARDARRRGKSPALVVLLCVLSFPLGLVAWLVFRPDPSPLNRKRFRLEDW